MVASFLQIQSARQTRVIIYYVDFSIPTSRVGFLKPG